MKENKIYKSGDYYEVKYDGGYRKSYKTYEESINDIYKYYKDIKTMDMESELEKKSRIQREKALKRNNKIDQILG